MKTISLKEKLNENENVINNNSFVILFDYFDYI